MKKKISMLLVFLLLIASFSGCSKKTDNADGKVDSEAFGIGKETGYTPYVGALFSLPYFIDHKVGLEISGKIYGRKTAVSGPGEYDMTALSTAIEQQIPQNPTAMFVSAFEDTIAPSIDKAVAAGIPVFTIDMDTIKSNRDVFIGGDTIDYGRVHARAIAEALGGKGKILIHYNVGQNSQDQRAEGFKDELKNYPDIQIIQEVAGQTDTSKDADAIKAALQANPDIDGISTMVSTGGVAAATAVRELGKTGEITIIADSKDDSTLKLIESGDLYATVAIKTITENLYAQMLVDGMLRNSVSISADDKAAGINALPGFIDIGTYVIKKDTVKNFYQKADPFDYSDLKVTEPSKDDVYYLIGGLLEQPYFIDHKMGFETACNELGVTGRFIGPSGYDMTAEAQMIEDAISQKPKGILVMAFEDTLTPAINKAKAAGIPVITIDMDTIDSQRDFFVGGDTLEYGRIHARTIAQALNGEGKILIHYNVGQNSQDQRAKGFKEELAKYPGIQIVQEVGGQADLSKDSDALKAALQAHPEVDGISTMVSTGGVAAATAVRELGKTGEITIIADSKDEATLKLIESGEINSTVAIKTRIEPYIAMKILALKNYTNIQVSQDDSAAQLNILPNRVDIGTFVINQDNAKYFYLSK
ncbi:MAG TPA: sugar ABC transporter substrate-binding protein [Clostridiales bacterium]|nr:sugar ABC transporter substrate-binding protein [Clostridiales bacterium]